MKNITKKIKDATQFSNFAQRIKVKWWNKEHPAGVKESDLDDILLLSWEELLKDRTTACPMIVEEIIANLPEKEKLTENFDNEFEHGFNECLYRIKTHLQELLKIKE